MSRSYLRTSDLARAVGVHPNTVRLYEEWGMLPPIPRTPSGYRKFDESTVDRLTFIQRAKELGFTLNEIKELLALRVERSSRCADVKSRAEAKIADIDEKRNLKLDATVLRKEKRHEIVQFWKDVTELGSELTELTEKFEVEKKITDLFKELGDEK